MSATTTPETEPIAHATPSRTHAMPIVAIANQKGGVGKTTTTVATAVILASRGARVLLIDLDPQGNATSSLGIDKGSLVRTTYDLLIGRARATDAARPTGRDRLDIVATNSNLAAAEIELVDMDDRERQLERSLAGAADRYDLVLIDCPPSLGLLTVNAFTAAGSIVVPIQCEFLPLEGLTQLQRTITQVRQHLNPGLTIAGVLMTMYDARTRLSAQVVEEVRRFYPKELFGTVIPRTIRMAEAPSYGLSIAEYDPRSNGATAYQKLVDELASRIGLALHPA
ncbi:MAG TPA: AAA family ATPase [Thermomicrobiales bacterium]|nr:AAA family ATPase [Thermomicrobiales bacterium]